MEIINLLILFLVIFPSIIITLRLKRKRNPPGPPGLPLIGNLFQLKRPLHKHFWQLSKKYGPLVYIKLGSRPVIIANSPRLAEEILKTQDLNFCSRPALLALRKLSYNGFDIVFSPYSVNWREMKKTCVLHLLSTKRVQSFRPIREDEVSRMIQVITKHASSSDTINLSEMIIFLTSTIISRVAFGMRYEHDSGERREFNHIIHDFNITLSRFYVSDYFPWIGWIDNLTGKIAELEKVFKKWDLFYKQVIDEHLRPDRPKSLEEDVVDILLKLRDEESESFHFPLDHIKAVLMNVYFASTDTTSTTIIWAMTSLIKNPITLKKVQAEIRDLLTLQVKKQMLEEGDINMESLPYLNAVIRESLRLYTTVPLLAPRETIKTCTVDGFEIPAKTLVYVNAWALGNDPELWKNPEEFRPERFLVDGKLIPYDYKGQDFDLVPFGGGRRGCPGISMAMATIQIVLANLLYMFDWDLPNGLKNEDVDTEILDAMAMNKKNPLCLIAKKFVA